MRRTDLLALPILLAALVTSAAADDRDHCNDGNANRETRLTACSSAIGSGQWSGADLARLHVSRAEQYTYSRQRSLDKALEDCEAALAIDANYAAAYRWRGVVYYERKEFDRAIAELDRAIALSPRFAGAYYDRGRAFAGRQDEARALADYDEAIKIAPKYAAPYNTRGFIQLARGQTDAAIADFNEAIKLDPKFTAPYYNRSRALVRKLEFGRALADADTAVRIDPQYLNGYIQRGYVLLAMRNFDGALAAFDRAAEVDPKSPRPPYGRGDVLLEKKDFDRAIAEYGAAIKLDPSSAYAYFQRGFTYFRKGDLDQALKDASGALRQDAKSAGAYNLRGLVQHAKHDYDEALADLTQAIRIDPSSSNYYSNRGRTYNARKEFSRAILDLNESIRLHPANPLPYVNRAMSYENQHERDKALADWRTTLRLDPDNQNAIKAIRRLEQETAAPGAVKPRVALVIGNSEYKYGARLANPVNDAGDFAALLRKLGFDVIEGRDLDKRGMDEKIAEFARKLDKAGIGLFFYAGHGIQFDGDNWLLPIDARIEPGDLRTGRSAKVKSATINVAQVLTKMEAEQRVNLVFLDACRDNPFGKGTGGFAPPKGLAPIQNAVGTLTAFATKPHHVALDGDGRNSPFTTALLKHVATPGLEIISVMKRVRADVITSTGGEQVPFDESSLITDVVLVR